MVVVVAVANAVVEIARNVAPVIPDVAQALQSQKSNAEKDSAFTVKTPDGWLVSITSWGLFVIGTDIHNTNGVTFDCWKPILRDSSTDPSNGKIMKEIIEDPRIKQVIVKEGGEEGRPDIRLVNIWDEAFDIQYVTLPTGHLAMHAVPTDSP